MYDIIIFATFVLHSLPTNGHICLILTYEFYNQLSRMSCTFHIITSKQNLRLDGLGLQKFLYVIHDILVLKLSIHHNNCFRIINALRPTKKWSNPIIHTGDNIGCLFHLFIHDALSCEHIITTCNLVGLGFAKGSWF